MNNLKFQCALSCKGTTPFSQSFFEAKDLKEAETKGAQIAKDFKTMDQRLKEFIKENGGVISTVTQLN